MITVFRNIPEETELGLQIHSDTFSTRVPETIFMVAWRSAQKILS
jgi:hypothetical protein